MIKILIGPNVCDFQADLRLPETGLYPEKQVKYVYSVFPRLAALTGTFVVTTHSPYILTALNNLIYAHQVGQKEEKKVSEVILREMWIDPERVDAYFVDDAKTLTFRSIIAENGLIEASEIDSGSVLVNSDFANLIALDYDEEPTK